MAAWRPVLAEGRPLTGTLGAVLANAARPAVEALLDQPYRFACEHVLASTTPALEVPVLVCSRHPEAGLMCFDCLAVHLHALDEDEPYCETCHARQVHHGVMFSLWDQETGGVCFRHPLHGEAITGPGAVGTMVVLVCPTCGEGDR